MVPGSTSIGLIASQVYSALGKEALTSAATGELVFLFGFDLGKCGNLDVEVFVGNNSTLPSSIDLTCHAYRLIHCKVERLLGK